MNDIDRQIQDALRQPSDAAAPAEYHLTEEMLAAFRGQHRWLSFLFVTIQLVAVAGLAYAAYRFFNAPEIAAQLRWGALGFVLCLLVSLLKIWFWMEMHSHRVLREVKRLELLLTTRR